MLFLHTILMVGSDTSRTRLVERIFRLRTLGLGLGFFAVAGVLLDHGAPPWVWTLLAIDALSRLHASNVRVPCGATS